MFDAAEYTSRADRVRRALAEHGLDLFIADHGELFAYLTGFIGSETLYRACMVPASGDPWGVLRALDVAPCRQVTTIEELRGFPDTSDPIKEVADSIRDKGLGDARIGADFRSYGFTALVRDRLSELLAGAELVDLTGLSDRVRATKSPREIAALEKAAAIADGTMRVLHAAVRPGMSPRQAASIAAAELLRLGADTGEVGRIVKGRGGNEFLHGALSDEPLAPSDILHVELTPRVLGYSGRLMRPIVVGVADPALQATADRLIELQDRQFAAMTPGTRAAAADAVLRDGVLAAGLRDHYENVTGYMTGLYGRTPRSSDFSYVFLPTSDWRLEAGMTFHMYTSAHGLGVSETVVVEPSGARRLTRTRRQLLIADA